MRMPNDNNGLKPQSMQRSELLKTNISLCSVPFGAKSQESGKKQHIIHSTVPGIVLMPTGTQSKSRTSPILFRAYCVSGVRQGLRVKLKTETVLSLEILESNKEGQ